LQPACLAGIDEIAVSNDAEQEPDLTLLLHGHPGDLLRLVHAKDRDNFRLQSQHRADQVIGNLHQVTDVTDGDLVARQDRDLPGIDGNGSGDARLDDAPASRGLNPICLVVKYRSSPARCAAWWSSAAFSATMSESMTKQLEG